MAGEAGQSFVVLGDLGENQCVVVGRNGVQSNGVAVPEVVFFPASTPAGSVTKVGWPYLCKLKVSTMGYLLLYQFL